MADKEARNNISKDKSLEIAISQIEKEFGKGSIMRLGDTGAAMTDVVAISTGSMALDLALGIGGVPAGRIVEIFGSARSSMRSMRLIRATRRRSASTSTIC